MRTSLAKIEEIVIAENRQRRVFDEGKHMELCNSIQARNIGLMHPVVLRVQDGKKVLVAGERRLRAFRDSHELGIVVWHAGEAVPHGMIPFTNIGEMDELDAKEAELEENIRRVDLSWQERAAATQELMALRATQAERKGLPAPTVAAIAEEVRGSAIGGPQTDTRAELIVAKHLHDPDVAAAPSLRKAVKVLQRKEEIKRNEQLAANLGKGFSSRDHTLVHADSESWITSVADATFSVVVTDPPYGMGADEFGDSGGMAEGGHDYDDSPEVFERILGWLPGQLFRVTKPDAHAYIFCDIDWFLALRSRMAEAGWKVFRTPLIWHKPAGFRAPWPEHGPQRKYETLLYAIKGDRKATRLAGDVITVPPDDNLGHMAQKPVALYEELLSRSARPGDKVLDLFCGSGPIFPAAHGLKLYATGVEKEASSYGLSAKRLKELK